MKKLLLVVSVLLLAASLSNAQTSATATLSVTVGNEAAIRVDSSPALTAGSGTFADYTSTTGLTYWIRTSTGGAGHITLKVTSDFACGGGPCVAVPPSTSDALTYSSTIVAPGTTGTVTSYSNQTASTADATPVADFSASAQSLKAGNTGTVAWTLTNDPAYKAGTYSATVTLTISAT